MKRRNWRISLDPSLFLRTFSNANEFWDNMNTFSLRFDRRMFSYFETMASSNVIRCSYGKELLAFICILLLWRVEDDDDEAVVDLEAWRGSVHPIWPGGSSATLSKSCLERGINASDFLVFG